MRSEPEGLDGSTVADVLRDGWSFETETLRYLPVGAGSYHWEAASADGARCFVTVDDLDTKTWLGETRDASFAGLREAFETAAALHDAGLGLVVAPLRGHDGEPLRRLDDRYSIAAFPFVDGRTEEWGAYEDESDAVAVVEMLAVLHRASVVQAVRTTGFDLPGRHHIENALRDVDVAWTGGPLSEPARAAVKSAASEIAVLLDLADRLASAAPRDEWVVTHGEPHRANVVRTATGPRLVDWDTVALGPRERDLWLVVERAGDRAAVRYAAAAGAPVDDTALDYFRLIWDLKDVAEYLNVVRSPHVENEDTVRAYEALTRCGTIRQTWKRHSQGP